MSINSKPSTLYEAGKRGAIYGFVTYSIYNGVNMSIFNDWTEKISLIDISWGTLFNCISACLYFMYE